MNIKLLRNLCETPGVAGREYKVRNLIQSKVDSMFDEITIDNMGSLICKRNSRSLNKNIKPIKVMLLCHMDEIGFLVSYISKEGFIYVNPLGGFDLRNLFARRVLISTENCSYKGVMNASGKPIHISSLKDRNNIPNISNFFIDIGYGEETKKMISIGDMVTMDEPFIETKHTIISKALDNRIACWLGIEVIKNLINYEHNCEIYVAFTCQEEVGLRGARTAAFKVQPDISIGVDVTLSCDTPGVPKHEESTKQGKGFGLHIQDGSFISHLELVKSIEKIAIKENIKFQKTLLKSGGQDAAAAQQAGIGSKAIGISVGIRYIHTVTEMVNKDDLESAKKILIAYLKSI